MREHERVDGANTAERWCYAPAADDPHVSGCNTYTINTEDQNFAIICTHGRLAGRQPKKARCPEKKGQRLRRRSYR